VWYNTNSIASIREPGDVMATKKMTRLKVLVDGKRRSITVPSARANALHTYLRSNKVLAAPPVPYFTGFDSIELSEGSDNTTVDRVLKCWYLAGSTSPAST
jgi:hypothetical protein